MFEELNRLLSQSVSDKSSGTPVLRLHEGERRIVSILFADVKGFTALSEQLDPEQVHAIMDKLMQLFTICIKNYGGFVDKYEGDKVMALFGAREASERDTERSLMAALDMLEKLELFNDILAAGREESELRIDIRIGINTGLVITGRVGEKREGDFTVYGDAVNLAARMEENAPINSIMVPLDVKLAVEDRFIMEERGSIEIKGKKEPVTVFTVTGSRKTSAIRREEWRFPFIGRERELETLSSVYDSLKDTSDPFPSIVAVCGSAGMGKTRLVSRFVRTILVENAEGTLRHASVPPFAQTPYCLFTDLVGNFAGIDRGDSRETVREKLQKEVTVLSRRIPEEAGERLLSALPLLGYLFGLDSDDPRLQHDPKILKDHVMLALRHFVEALAHDSSSRGGPLVLVLEDLQWVDEASVAVLEHVLKTLNLESVRDGTETCRIMVILTYRPEFQPSDSLSDLTGFRVLVLEPLSEEECGELLEGTSADQELIRDRRKELLEKSEGNPFFLEEWVKLLHTMDGIQDDLSTLPVPDTLTSLMLSRIDRLEKDLKLLLQKASVNGMDFSSDVLRYIEQQLNRMQVIDAQLVQLLDRGFVCSHPDDLYSFSHAVTRDVSYNTLLKANRRILHRLIGEYLEKRHRDRLPELYTVLAYHYERAEEKEKALEYLCLAADDAERKFDLRNSVAHVDSMVRIYSDLVDRTGDGKRDGYIVELSKSLMRKGKLLESLGRWDDSAEAYDKALASCQSLTDMEAISARIRNNIGVIQWRRGQMEEALKTIEDAMAVLESEGDQEGIIQATLNKANINLLQGNYDYAIECYGKVTEYYSEICPDEHRYSLYTGNIGIAYMYKFMFPEAEKHYMEQLEICERLDDRHGIATVTLNLGELYRTMGKLGKAVESFNTAHRMFEEIGDTSRCGTALGNIGVVQYTRGDFEDALDSYRNAIEILRRANDKFYANIYTGNSAITYMHMGRFDEAEECFDRAVAEAEEMNSRHLLAFWLQYRAENYFHSGEYRKAFETNARGLETAREVGNPSCEKYCSIYRHRYRFELLDDDKQREEECILPLLKMLEEVEEPEFRAIISRDLALMYSRLGNEEEHLRHRSEAIELCRQLEISGEDFQWREIIEELGG